MYNTIVLTNLIYDSIASTESVKSKMSYNSIPPKFSYINVDHILLLEASSGSTSGVFWGDIVSIGRLKYGLSSIYERKPYASQNHLVDANKCINFLKSRGFVVWTNPGVVFAVLDDASGQYADTFVRVTLHNQTVNIELTGDQNTIHLLLPEFSKLLTPLGTLIFTASSIKRDGSPGVDVSHLSKDDSNVACNSFFPWLSVSLDDYFKAFMESDESVLVMFGPPGTGKSTFLRSLILSGNYASMLAYNKVVVQSPETLKWFYSCDDAKILAYEDIDTHLGSREDGNDLMSSILNGAEGIISHPGKKLVFSTNLESVDKIDPALLRVGRCFDILEFRHLTPDEATNVLTDMGAEQKDFSSKSKWSLAEVLSKKNPAQQRINRFSKKTGFLPR